MILLGDGAVNFRVGDAAVPRIYRGDEVAWSRNVVHFQQLVFPYAKTETRKGVTFENLGTGEWHVYGTATDSNCFGSLNGQSGQVKTLYVGHHYAIYGTITGTPSTQCVLWSTMRTTDEGFIGVDGKIMINTKQSADSYVRHQVNFVTGATFETVDYHIFPMVFDLDAMFADCPELMPTTVAGFKQMFPATYYPYTEQPYDVYI